MRVLVFEDNLMWSVRLKRSIEALGHEAMVVGDLGENGDLAIVNLGRPEPEVRRLVGGLLEQGMKVVGHAGHKEKDLQQIGMDSGCQAIVSNSTLTFKLAEVLNGISA